MFEKEKMEGEARIEEIKKIELEETALAYVSLKWMIEAADDHGLLLDKEEVAKDLQISNSNAKLHNPLLPLWWILGWRKRWTMEGENKYGGMLPFILFFKKMKNRGKKTL